MKLALKKQLTHRPTEYAFRGTKICVQFFAEYSEEDGD